jgi:VanZ family protein
VLPLRWARWWAAGGWIWGGLIVVSSLWPGGVPTPVHIWDKLEHAVSYALLILWFTGLYPRGRYLSLALWCAALGVAMELAQGYLTTSRSMDILDVCANSVGILVGLGISWVLTGGWAVRAERLLRHQPA